MPDIALFGGPKGFSLNHGNSFVFFLGSGEYYLRGCEIYSNANPAFSAIENACEYLTSVCIVISL